MGDEELVDEIADVTSDAIEQLTTELEAGDMSLDEYREAVEDLLEDAYIQQATLANNKKPIVGIFLAVITGMLIMQVDRLIRALDLYTQGRISVGEVGRRGGMYANSSRQAYWGVRDRIERGDGKVEEHWLAIGDKNTCTPCAEAEQMGWVPIGTLGLPGSGIVLLVGGTTCRGLTHCRCAKIYR